MVPSRFWSVKSLEIAAIGSDQLLLQWGVPGSADPLNRFNGLRSWNPEILKVKGGGESRDR